MNKRGDPSPISGLRTEWEGKADVKGDPFASLVYFNC